MGKKGFNDRDMVKPGKFVIRKFLAKGFNLTINKLEFGAFTRFRGGGGIIAFFLLLEKKNEK